MSSPKKKEDKLCKKGGTRWWTWAVVGVVIVALAAGFTFRYELFGSASVRTVRRLGRLDKTGDLTPLRKVQEEVLADTINAALDALESADSLKARQYFNSAIELTSDSSIRTALSNLLASLQAFDID